MSWSLRQTRRGSGLVSVIFLLATIFNVVNARLIYGVPISGRAVLAGMIGVLGLILLFWQDLAVQIDPHVVQGMGWATLGTMLFSLGNMASRRNTAEGVTPVIANAWGMGIGAGVLLIICLLRGVSWHIPTAPDYLWSLLYLTTIGTIVAFTTYLMLVARIGSARAAYATVLFPVVALMLSTLFEGYQWSATAIFGILLTMLGNVVLFAGFPTRRSRQVPAS